MSTTTKEKIGYLILNTGTPDAPTIPALKSYLKEFLSDPDMLDYPSTRPDELAKGFDKVKNFPNNFLLDAHLLYSSKLKRIEIISFESQFLTRVNNKPKGGGSILGKIKLSALTMKYLFTFRKNKKIY